jgi:hypothetical protein
MTLEAVLKEALALTPEQRRELGELMLRSVRNDVVDLTPAQREDLRRRIAEDDAGESDPVDGEAFLESLRNQQ